MQIHVRISDARISSSADDVLVTHSLGSCIGVTLYDGAAKVGGMLHFQLPSCAIDSRRSKSNPFMFGDSGLNALLDLMKKAGAVHGQIRCIIAGGARMLADFQSFDIGKHNHVAIRRALRRHGITIESEDCGGDEPRTMLLNMNDGSVSLKRAGIDVSLN